MSSISVSLRDIKNLDIQAVTFACMAALFGMYFTLFIIALCCTFRKTEQSHKNLRIVTIVLFIITLTHLICCSLEFNQARRIPQPTDTFYKWVIPLRIVENISGTLEGAVSDDLLAYRFYIIFGRKRWALYIPAIAITATTLLRLAESLANLAIYRPNGDSDYANFLGTDLMSINAA